MKENLSSAVPKLDIQAAGVNMNNYLHRKIRNMITKLKKHFPDINFVDVYLKTNEASAKPCTVLVRFGIPGPDLVASDSGERWKIILKNVEKRLARQLKKRKALPYKIQH